MDPPVHTPPMLLAIVINIIVDCVSAEREEG